MTPRPRKSTVKHPRRRPRYLCPACGARMNPDSLEPCPNGCTASERVEALRELEAEDLERKRARL